LEGIDMIDHTVWVTYSTIRLRDGRVLLVQKNDGSTRSVITGTRHSRV
jgi:hypothetical protein